MGKDVPTFVHAPFTIFTLFVFAIAVQQLCGAPLDKVKVFRYRLTVVINAFIVAIIAISLNINLEQNVPTEPEDDEDPCKNSETAFAELVSFIKTMQVLNTCACLVLGYWFLVDAVRAAFKATRGIVKLFCFFCFVLFFCCYYCYCFLFSLFLFVFF